MSLIEDVWRGRVRLWVTYWVWGVAGNLAFAVGLVWLRIEAAAGEMAGVWIGALYAASLGWFVLIFGAIWRAAGRYRGPRVWSVLARAGVLAGCLRMAGEAVVLAT